ncbi:hypothetical protein ACFXJ8_20690 [Nonomuraea sp. NPDC059194]|uniref:hypothetical protein n=1 Tax=Nonomuraea sp. NPDC059194 TaxID=3346764 RepID=UPI0036A74A29
MAVLATGMIWAAGPASAEECGRRIAVNDGATLASFCDKTADVRTQATQTSMAAPKGSETAMTVEQLAKKAGLPGMSRTTGVLSVSDMAGVAAGAGHPSLPEGLPQRAGLPEVTDVSTSPDLPGLSSLPEPASNLIPVEPVLPPQSAVSDAQDDSGQDIDQSSPVDSVVRKVEELVPDAVADVPLSQLTRVAQDALVPDSGPAQD